MPAWVGCCSTLSFLSNPLNRSCSSIGEGHGFGTGRQSDSTYVKWFYRSVNRRCLLWVPHFGNGMPTAMYAQIWLMSVLFSACRGIRNIWILLIFGVPARIRLRAVHVKIRGWSSGCSLWAGFERLINSSSGSADGVTL